MECLPAVLLQRWSDSLKYPEHVLHNTEIHALIPEQQQEQETTWRQTKYLHCSDKQSGTKESVPWLRHVAHSARTKCYTITAELLQYLGRWPFAFRQVKSWKWLWGFPICCTHVWHIQIFQSQWVTMKTRPQLTVFGEAPLFKRLSCWCSWVLLW